MSGILEHIDAKLDKVLAILGGAGQQLAAQGHTPVGGAQPLAQQQQQLQATALPGGGASVLGGAPTASGVAPPTGYPPATQEMIVALVTPLVNDPNTKAALQQEMHAMGISALPEAQPHQYPELYYRFQQVQLRAQQAQPQQPAAAPASII